MAYLYRHIRLDKNEPFYIGIGSDEKYKRAYSKKRSKFWKNIISKTNYEVEIVLDNLTWEEACKKEKEFIKLYGRKDLNEGSLVNMTDGGDGICGYKHTEIAKNKIAKNWMGDNNPMKKIKRFGSLNNHYGKKHSNEAIEKMKGPRKSLRKQKSEIQKQNMKKPKSEDHRKNISIGHIGVFHKIVKCPHCNKLGGAPGMTRYHFNNCKNKS